MSITADYHLHSHHSGDSEAPMADMADAALARGLTEICFTEHEDLDFPDSADGPGSIFLLDAATYRSEWETLHPQYAGRLDIRFGVELGLQPHLVEQNRAFLTAQPYDFVIGSVHIADRRDPYYPDFYEGRTLQEAYRAYFEDVLENIRLMPEIDVLGHMDYPVRYAPGGEAGYHPADYADLTDEILRTCIAHDIGLDVNSSALIRGGHEPNPCRTLLSRYHELGGRLLTAGSDAHKPEHVAGCFDQIRSILLSLGFDSFYTFDARRPIAHKL